MRPGWICFGGFVTSLFHALFKHWPTYTYMKIVMFFSRNKLHCNYEYMVKHCVSFKLYTVLLSQEQLLHTSRQGICNISSLFMLTPWCLSRLKSWWELCLLSLSLSLSLFYLSISLSHSITLRPLSLILPRPSALSLSHKCAGFKTQPYGVVSLWIGRLRMTMIWWIFLGKRGVCSADKPGQTVCAYVLWYYKVEERDSLMWHHLGDLIKHKMCDLFFT